jgi:hypothetical protein
MTKESYNKYGNIRTMADGFTFASILEANRYYQLKLLAGAGHITMLKLQPRFNFLVNGQYLRYCPTPLQRLRGKQGALVTYVADFSYFDVKTHMDVVEDAKGVETDVFKMKKALMMATHGINVLIIKGKR